MSEPPSDQPAQPSSSIAGRKRVSARVLAPDEAPSTDQVRPLDTAPQADSAFSFPQIAQDAPTVIDPATLGGRQRRSSHHRLYRWTQFFTLLAIAAAGVSLLLTLSDELTWARILGCCALGVAGIGIRLSSRSHLSRRWRGWAFAAAAFAVSVLLLSFIHSTLVGDDSPEPRPAKKSSAP